jgi:hypothetical protein
MLVTGHFMPVLTHVPSLAADEITAGDAEPVALPLHDTQPDGHDGSDGRGTRCGQMRRGGRGGTRQNEKGNRGANGTKANTHKDARSLNL